MVKCPRRKAKAKKPEPDGLGAAVLIVLAMTLKYMNVMRLYYSDGMRVE